MSESLYSLFSDTFLLAAVVDPDAAITVHAPQGGSVALLLLYLGIALGVSAVCSVSEAAFLSVTPSFYRTLLKTNPKRGQLLAQLREKPDRPLAAILTINTVANVFGAAGVGFEAARIFGSAWLSFTSAIMTLMILVFSEIIPKTIGATYWKSLAGPLTIGIGAMVKLLRPLLYLMEFLTRGMVRTGGHQITTDEIESFAEMIHESRLLRPSQGNIVGNAIGLHEIQVRSILTPRSVVFSLPAEGSIEAHRKQVIRNPFSRIPLTDADSGEWIGFALKTEILAEDDLSRKLKTMLRELKIFHDTQPLIAAMRAAVRDRIHIAQVVNEFGDSVGIVTLEDMLETLLGEEILDESDRHADLQRLARERYQRQVGALES